MKTFLKILIGIFTLNCYSTNISEHNVILFLFSHNKVTNVYNSSDKNSVIALISNTSNRLYAFNVIEKEGDMIKVIAWNTANKKKIIGWIGITETSIIGRSRDLVYELYDNPSYNSKKSTVLDDWECYKFIGGKNVKVRCNIDQNFRVFDIDGKWLKVEVFGKDTIYRKWLPNEYQCRNIYGGCT